MSSTIICATVSKDGRGSKRTVVRVTIIDHDDSAHSGVTTHNVMVDDSNTYDGTFTSPTVLGDSSTYDSATHALVVPSASDQYVVTDPTSYDRARNYYSIQSPDGCSIRYQVVCHNGSFWMTVEKPAVQR